MANCRFHFDLIERFNAATIFKLFPNVNDLNLGQNYLSQIPNTLYLMIIQLDTLESLKLYSTNLLDLPRNVFTNLRKLSELNLKNNNLYSFHQSGGVFGNITSLKSLDLSSNLILIINKTLLPSTLLNSLKQINLGDNPFSCICDQKMVFRMD